MSEYLRLVEIKRNVFSIISFFSKLNLDFDLNVEIIKKLHADDIFEYLNHLKFDRNQL